MRVNVGCVLITCYITCVGFALGVGAVPARLSLPIGGLQRNDEVAEGGDRRRQLRRVLDGLRFGRGLKLREG